MLLNRIVRRSRKSALGKARNFKPAVAWSMHYGAVELDPKNLAIWYIFRTKAELSEAKANGLADRLDRWSREGLVSYRYPQPVVSLIHVSFASDEDIKAAGGFREYFA